MHLPSFLWLWKIAAWSMGLSILAYLILLTTGSGLLIRYRLRYRQRALLIITHYMIGLCLIFLVFILLAIGIIGTLGHYGNLGHSAHLWAGLITVILVVLSGFSATQINSQAPWWRNVHISSNICLGLTLIWVSITGWTVVQKYLP